MSSAGKPGEVVHSPESGPALPIHIHQLASGEQVGITSLSECFSDLPRRLLGLALIAILIAMAPAQAVILYGTGDPTANTSAPTGGLSNSGWQYEGQFNGFLGTVIAANYFITAKHIGGTVGDTFVLNGITYTTTAVFPDPSSDFQVWRISGTFAMYAPLFSDNPGSESNLSSIVFGRGTQRGNAVNVGGNSQPGGWLWGNSDGVERWGTNIVASVQNDPTYGSLLRVPFDATGGRMRRTYPWAIPAARFSCLTRAPINGNSRASTWPLMGRLALHPAARIHSMPQCSTRPVSSCRTGKGFG